MLGVGPDVDVLEILLITIFITNAHLPSEVSPKMYKLLVISISRFAHSSGQFFDQWISTSLWLQSRGNCLCPGR